MEGQVRGEQQSQEEVLEQANTENDQVIDTVPDILPSITYTAERSRELLESQFETFRSLSNKAGIILNMLAIFIPIFLFIIDKAALLIKGLSVISMIFFIGGIACMFRVLYIFKLYRGIKQDQYDTLINNTLTDNLLYEIAANKISITENDQQLSNQNKFYIWGLWSVIFSVIFSTILLTFSIFTQEKQNMSDKPVAPKVEGQIPKAKVTLPNVPTSELKIPKNQLDTSKR